MPVIYLKLAARDLGWFHRYYADNFPEGRDKAWHRYLTSLRLILQNPAIGAPYDLSYRRRHVVPNTPFVIYYQIKNGRLEIARVWDTRRNSELLTFDETES
jgi:toxin ParE1/3/4